MARDLSAGGQVESRAARLGELLRRWLSHQSVSGARQLHSDAVAPVVALQAQGQATPGRDVSTLAPLRALRSRTPDRAWAQRAVGEGVTSCPRVGCGGIGGGMARDVLLADIPLCYAPIFMPSPPWPGAAVVVIGAALRLPVTVVTIAGAVLCFGLRFMAIRRGWHLPLAEGPDELDMRARAPNDRKNDSARRR